MLKWEPADGCQRGHPPLHQLHILQQIHAANEIPISNLMAATNIGPKESSTRNLYNILVLFKLFQLHHWLYTTIILFLKEIQNDWEHWKKRWHL